MHTTFVVSCALLLALGYVVSLGQRSFRSLGGFGSVLRAAGCACEADGVSGCEMMVWIMFVFTSADV